MSGKKQAATLRYRGALYVAVRGTKKEINEKMTQKPPQKIRFRGAVYEKLEELLRVFVA